ncbi:amyloid protein-binding protein 2 isoform X2 [Hydra vulgaris]|uniref:Amyloid protein-binding protein 2 isoform X2 n=1 Tax=Hydra vulgaris TaxID=6087 RepID=A0ABM4CNG8_HYDVU
MGNEAYLAQKDPCYTASPLYDVASVFIANKLPLYSELIENIPNSLIIDIYEKAYNLCLTDNLYFQLSDLRHFENAIKDTENWNIVHKCVHILLVKRPNFGILLASQKAAEYLRDPLKIIEFTYKALQLGAFFLEHGLYDCSKIVYQSIDIVDLNGNIDHNILSIAFEVALRVGHVLTLNCNYNDANTAILNASILLTYMQNCNLKPNCAFYYTLCSMYMFSLSQYDKAYNLALQAVQELNDSLPPKIIVDTLRQACKACIIKRLFCEARVYTLEALKLARYWFGIRHLKYADCLSDFAFYLLSIDNVGLSVKYYEMALSVRKEQLGEKNILTAMTHEDLAYALYVRDYSKGDFEHARVHAEQALMVLLEILPVDHLLLSSSKRVEALILEEVAIDSDDPIVEDRLLKCAESLHMDSLRLAKNTFGEYNVQTAKHYGNLGRLYQSMKKYKEAEANHLKAIYIKEKLLSCSDYEVALSIGHLASLYNYDMKKYDEAEQLYKRSIEIGRKLFGVWYSGLEYDYRGLIHLYEETGCHVEAAHYRSNLADWKFERDDKFSKALYIEPQEDYTDQVCVKTILQNVKDRSIKSGS